MSLVFSFHMPSLLLFASKKAKYGQYLHDDSGEAINRAPPSIRIYRFQAACICLFFTFSAIKTAFEVCMPKKIQRISVFLFLALTFASE